MLKWLLNIMQLDANFMLTLTDYTVDQHSHDSENKNTVTKSLSLSTFTPFQSNFKNILQGLLFVPAQYDAPEYTLQI